VSVTYPLVPLLVLIALASTALPILLLNVGTSRIGASRSALLGTLEPASGIALAILLGHETFAPAQLAGVALLLGTVALARTA
jgi:drug/metabolite transporter (DMT)-like permease